MAVRVDRRRHRTSSRDVATSASRPCDGTATSSTWAASARDRLGDSSYINGSRFARRCAGRDRCRSTSPARSTPHRSTSSSWRSTPTTTAARVAARDQPIGTLVGDTWNTAPIDAELRTAAPRTGSCTTPTVARRGEQRDVPAGDRRPRSTPSCRRSRSDTASTPWPAGSPRSATLLPMTVAIVVVAHRRLAPRGASPRDRHGSPATSSPLAVALAMRELAVRAVRPLPERPCAAHACTSPLAVGWIVAPPVGHAARPALVRRRRLPRRRLRARPLHRGDHRRRPARRRLRPARARWSSATVAAAWAGARCRARRRRRRCRLDPGLSGRHRVRRRGVSRRGPAG